MVEPPATYTIQFKSGVTARYRIDKSTIEQIATDWKHSLASSSPGSAAVGAYDVEAQDESYRKLIFRFEDVLYIG